MGATSVFSNKTPSSGANIWQLSVANQKFTISDSVYDWEEKVLPRIQELIKLEPGWDGYNGQPLSLENGYFALKMLEVIYSSDSPPPQIVPGVNGDLQIEWHSHAVEIELHILAPNEVHAWVMDSESFPEGREFELSTDFIVIAHQIRKLTDN